MAFPAADTVLVVLTNRDPPTASQQVATLWRAALNGQLCH